VTTVEIGRYATGAPMCVDVAQLHTLISGLSGSGKSSTLRALLVGAARDPTLALVLLDVKRVEFAVWRPRASVVAVDHDHISAVLGDLATLIDDRYRQLDDEGANAWEPTVARPGVLVAIDELAGLTASGDRDRDRDNTYALRHVLERGRAAGVITTAAIQRPSAEVLPTSIRDLFACRILHALADSVSVQMAAGGGAQSTPAHTIPVGPRSAGLAYVLLDGERIGQAARSYWVSPEAAAQVAQRTATYRHALFTPPLPSPPSAPVERPVKSSLAPTAMPGSAFPRSNDTADENMVLAVVTAAGSIPARDLPARCGLSDGRARRAAQRLAIRHLLHRSGSTWVRTQ
jgi:S-DNA-T family DNA segregation ATPase FtsK/SpoIIIE